MADENDDNSNETASEEPGTEASGGDFDANVELFSEYYEGSLPSDKQAEIEKLIAEDERYTRAYADFEKTMEMLSGMHKMSAPMDFDKKVEDTIHRRSDGRFFGRRAFGDRIPYEILAVLVMILAAFVYWMGRTSGTGGHKLNDDGAPAIHKEAQDVMPKR
jgi:hypothetical protein